MPNTLTNLGDILNDVLSEINEAQDSPLGELHSGDGTTITIPTTTTLTQYFNDAQNDLARTCYPVPDMAQYTLSAGQRVVSLAASPSNSGGRIWCVRQAAFAGQNLNYIGRAYAELYFPFFAPEGTGQPTCFYQDGLGYIGVAPMPFSPDNLVVAGFITPVPLNNSSDVPTWLEPSLYKLIVAYIVNRVILKNLENSDIAPRQNSWAASYSQGKQELLARLSQEDRSIFENNFSVGK